MSTNIEHRKVCLVARAAADLHSHATSPYLKITLGDETVATVPDKHHGSNPVYDQQFNISCPGATPNESPMSLRVIAKNTTHLLPDIELGSGVLELHDLFIKGKQEARVPLRDSSGNNAGVAYIGLSVLPEETELPICTYDSLFSGFLNQQPRFLLQASVWGIF